MKRESSIILLILSGYILVGLTGCVSPGEQLIASPGKDTVSDALFALHGQCLLCYRDDRGSNEKYNLSLRYWINPPVKIHFKGYSNFAPKAVVMASNDKEFWLAINTDEIKDYYWGYWSQSEYIDGLIISPKIVTEALGIAPLGDDMNFYVDWSLDSDKYFDILCCTDSDGRLFKRIYVYKYDYTIRRIEYFDSFGQLIVDVQLSEYKKAGEGFRIPTKMEIARYENGDLLDSMRITIGSIKSYEFTKEVEELLFTRASSKGYENVYEVIDGRIYRQ
jgi:hypothetical protein